MLKLLTGFALLKGGELFMQVFVTIYVSLIVAGRRTIEQVPANLRDAVKTDLDALNGAAE
ncbi:hypothetical protein DCC85_14485 [Paenibacillus sp. CAA11]|uniref:CD1375 family protein n=1 Tax=Paenibacillus sp. CAA11 TaxID=1532905 RepID=UPI000D39D5E4|nr:CD1375 family protein [Paenibacillus sp. CAA11]AWB45313.1 hypothetical protein DCC85_14485 [Paenibacillus sp. CAA11]